MHDGEAIKFDQFTDKLLKERNEVDLRGIKCRGTIRYGHSF